jgi:hypothetical protein
MISKSTLLAVTTLTVAAALPSATALAAQTTSYPAAKRPHSRIVTYDRGDVLVRRLQLQLTRSDHRLHGEVRLAARNETGHTITRELRVGPCVGGFTGYPTCRNEATFRVRIPAHTDVSLRRDVTLRQPPAGLDTVQAALVVSAASQPYAILRHSDASLLLRGNAWRGAGAGRVYGVDFHADGARRLSFDIPATSRGRAYIDVKWTGSAAPSAATTTISRCHGDDCAGQTLHPTSARSGPQTFGQRFDYEIKGADVVGLAAGEPGATLFDALLPWPG